MKTYQKYIVCLFVGMAMVLSLTSALPAEAVASSGENLSATTPPLLLNISAIALGGYHTCALTTASGVKCWGQNYSGQLGDGTTIHRPTPVDVSGLKSNISAISAGYRHACALTSGGGVKCWGGNWSGQLGDGTTTERHTPVNVSGLTNGISAISAGSEHTCALTSGGGVKCWGENAFGQLGDGTKTSHSMPVDVIGLTSGVTAISVGSFHTCALTIGGGVKCWGRNSRGQLGDGTTTDSSTPVDVSQLTSGIRSISAGGEASGAGHHTCALTVSGGVKCWGDNNKGQLGNGTTIQRRTPTDVTGLASGVSAISSNGRHTCALTASGGVMCWGRNVYGELGDGTFINPRTTPVNVSGLASGISAISAGEGHSCALTSLGRVKCWGHNSFGQLGDGSTIRRKTPVNVVILDQLIFRSTGARDGFIWESTETSNVGGSIGASDAGLYIGDDNLDRQYISILSFNTSALPDTAVIFSAMIHLYWNGFVGEFPNWSPIKVDICSPFFGTSVELLPHDFQAAPSRANVGTFPLNGDTASAKLISAAFRYINLTGNTQFRLRYQEDDNDNMSADYTFFSSGEEATALRPQLIIQYYVP